MTSKRHTGQAGEFYVCAEILRRGGWATPFAGNMPGFDVVALPGDGRPGAIRIQVKSKSDKHWQVNPDALDAAYDGLVWVFADLLPESPEFYVVPGEWIREDVRRRRREYRERRPDVTGHHAWVDVEHVAEWRDRWEVLGIFDGEEER